MTLGKFVVIDFAPSAFINGIHFASLLDRGRHPEGTRIPALTPRKDLTIELTPSA